MLPPSNGRLTVQDTAPDGGRQLAAGTLAIELGGHAPATAYGVLDVVGPVSLAGTLDVSLIGGFLPVTGDFFDNRSLAGPRRRGPFGLAPAEQA